jgi:hypothetical protein
LCFYFYVVAKKIKPCLIFFFFIAQYRSIFASSITQNNSNMKKLLLFSALVLICSTLFAQTPSNWLTFDTKQQPTTAGRLVVAQKSSFGLSFNDDLTQLNVQAMMIWDTNITATNKPTKITP